jgi:hypothetical protein
MGPQQGKPLFACVYIVKMFFSRISRLISIKLGTNYSWVKGIQNSSNKGPDLLQAKDNNKNTKMGWVRLKIFFSRTTGPEKLTLT